MERKHLFNEMVAEYDKYRPNYPDELFVDIANFANLKSSDHILEIGCGTGQATSGFVHNGFGRITCVELGDQLAAFTREKFKHKPGIQVIQSDFESWDSGNERFDLAISGTAFHFIQPQELGYRKVYDVLKPQGNKAFFWTVHVPGYDEMSVQIREIYRKYAPQLDDSTNPTMEETIQARTQLTVKEGLFQQLEVKTYRWEHAYSATEYIALLNTNSRHRLVQDDIRGKLFDEMKETIDRFGGTIRKPQAVILFMAKKRIR
ncbi:class I SAM-dependent methyltransferase [Paenibacillus glycanilyticus]|uniref:Methyltransferase type 11 n=1 Tax=Paenibacillus glycanilyticus TaxID=126569 RepID=A0ABQ6GK32_9BACL|nr:class I SAM-dependent methyltransferase [Paenibacillus glycanilyticus]GLX71249.1 methyltransferase type 11 [Paenibacillus glycanilyticus]